MLIFRFESRADAEQFAAALQRAAVAGYLYQEPDRSGCTVRAYGLHDCGAEVIRTLLRTAARLQLPPEAAPAVRPAPLPGRAAARLPGPTTPRRP